MFWDLGLSIWDPHFGVIWGGSRDPLGPHLGPFWDPIWGALGPHLGTHLGGVLDEVPLVVVYVGILGPQG